MPVIVGNRTLIPNKSSVSRCSLPGELWFREWPSYCSPNAVPRGHRAPADVSSASKGNLAPYLP